MHEAENNRMPTPPACVLPVSRYQFLVDTYATEIEKVLGVWAMFDDGDLLVRPDPDDTRGRNLLEHMVHQSLSENFWFSSMLDIKVTESPLPSVESRFHFMVLYRHNAAMRLQMLASRPDPWWEGETAFFDVPRSRAWVLTRRIAHTAHHRGQQTTLLRMIGRDLHSTYGPTADTGGLMQHGAPVVYPYPDLDTLMREERGARRKTLLPSKGDLPRTERP